MSVERFEKWAHENALIGEPTIISEPDGPKAGVETLSVSDLIAEIAMYEAWEAMDDGSVSFDGRVRERYDIARRALAARFLDSWIVRGSKI